MAIEKTQVIKAGLIAAIALAFLYVEGVCVDAMVWQSYTSYRDVRHMRVINDTLWMSTAGGLLGVENSSEPGRKIDNTGGLRSTNVHSLMEDALRRRWVACEGWLTRIEEGEMTHFRFSNRDDNPITLVSLEDADDFLWIGLDTGLVLFSKEIDGGQIERHYDQFGGLNPGPSVDDILLTGDSIYVATSSGLAAADLSNPSQISPASWTTWDRVSNPELRSDSILDLIQFDSKMFVATTNGLYYGVIDSVSGLTSFVEQPVAGSSIIYDLEVESDSLFVYHQWGVAVLSQGELTELFINGLPSVPQRGLRLNGVRWFGLTDGEGIYSFEQGAYQLYPYTGLPGNLVSDLAIGSDGIITAGFSLQPYATLRDSLWNTHDFWVRGGTTVSMADDDGDRWLGTHGNGLWRLTDDDSFVNFDETNSTLSGNSDGPVGATYVYISGLATDGENIFAAAYRAVDGNIIAFAPIDQVDDPAAWDAYGFSDGLRNDRPVSIDYYEQELAIATEGDGVYLCRLGGDPYDHAGVTCSHHTESLPFVLRSNTVRTLRYSPTGELWVGTNFGLSRWDWGTDRYIDIDLPEGISSDITALEFDGRGSLWIGTHDGLARRDKSSGEMDIFRVNNSPLIGDDITALAYDEVTGDLYVCTHSGLSVVRHTQGSDLTSVMDQVVPFPNPFIIRNGSELLQFTNAVSARVTLYSLAGELVRSLPEDAPWDGRNDSGGECASGVYIFKIVDSESNIGSGKILLVREQ